jgi:hypothetical protein
MDAKDSLVRNAFVRLVALEFSAPERDAQTADQPNIEKCAPRIHT